MMELVGFTRHELIEYICRQLNHFFPDGKGEPKAEIRRSIDDSLDRLAPCIRLNRVWPKRGFSYLHSNQYTVFLYFLANTIFRRKGDEQVCSKLFYLNKTLHAFECFYSIELPEIFCVCHSPGIVLAQATYANYFVLYQNSTVGRVNADERPVFSEGVVMFPNTAIIGNCKVGPRTYLSQGSSIINADSPGNCVVFSGGGKLICKPAKEDYLAKFFRFEDA